MFKLIYSSIIFYSLILNNVFAGENEYIIKQGDVQISFEDIDGYSYTMPNDIKFGFFESADRIESTLKTMLTMKHIVNYAISKDLLNNEVINNEISDYILKNSEMIKQLNLSDLEFLKLKKYIKLKSSYRNMQKNISDSVTNEELLELANEKYIVTKQDYYQKHTRDINYINIKYNEANKQQKLQTAESIKKELEENNLDFDKLSKKYQSDKDIVFLKGVNNFYYNEKYKEFSDFVFTTDNVGLIDIIGNIANNYIIAIITKISPEGYKEFSEVKGEIIAKLKKEKVKRKFGNLVAKLTTDPIEINEEAILSIRERYLDHIGLLL